MGFWDIAGKVAKGAVAVGKYAVEKSGEINEKANMYADRYSYCSREELISKFRNSSNTAEKMGIAKVMKQNGWSVND